MLNFLLAPDWQTVLLYAVLTICLCYLIAFWEVVGK